MKRTHTLSRVLVLAGILSGLALGRAEAALTLIINPITKTYNWSGSATSVDFTTPVGAMHIVRLGSGTWNGGTVSQDELTLAVSYILSSGGPASHVGGGTSGSYGGIAVAIPAGSETLSTSLGYIQGGSGPDSVGHLVVTPFTSASNSYAGFNVSMRTFIESLDGTPLYFQYWDGGPFVNIGPSAGQIVVIPEPSSALLLLGGCALMRRRRRG
jgi:hypothetical protein